MTENPALEALTEALRHPIGTRSIVDCCMASTYAHVYPKDEAAQKHDERHAADAAAILAALTASGHAIVTAAEAEAGRAVLAALDAVGKGESEPPPCPSVACVIKRQTGGHWCVTHGRYVA